VPIQTIIVDDEPVVRTRLRSMLARDPEIEVVAEVGDGREALAAIQRWKPALIFLDREVPNRDGLEVLSSLNWSPVTVAIVARAGRAVSPSGTGAVDILRKPFTQTDVTRMLARVKQQIVQAGPAAAPESGASAAVASVAADLLVVKAAGKLLFIRTSDLRWIEAEKDYVRLHLNNGSHFVRETMTNLQNRLDPRKFIRIHRSTIVNIHAISEVSTLTGSDCSVTLRDGTELTMSRRYRTALDRLLGYESSADRTASREQSASGSALNMQTV
jgi:two-component system LytT family response regulator